jgi:hypothetical protein
MPAALPNQGPPTSLGVALRTRSASRGLALAQDAVSGLLEAQGQASKLSCPDLDQVCMRQTALTQLLSDTSERQICSAGHDSEALSKASTDLSCRGAEPDEKTGSAGQEAALQVSHKDGSLSGQGSDEQMSSARQEAEADPLVGLEGPDLESALDQLSAAVPGSVLTGSPNTAKSEQAARTGGVKKRQHHVSWDSAVQDVNLETQKRKRRKKVIQARQGGIDGEFHRFLGKNLPGVKQDLVLGINSKGQQLKLEASILQKDYVHIDSRALFGVYPSSDGHDISEMGTLLRKCLDHLGDSSKADVGEARSWLRHSKDPVTGTIVSVPAPRYFPSRNIIRSKRIQSDEDQANKRME